MSNRDVETYRGYSIQETDTRGHIGYAFAVAGGVGNLVRGFDSIKAVKVKIDKIMSGENRVTRSP